MIEQQPRTIRDAVSILQRLLRPDELDVIKHSKKPDLARFHFNHGEYIRNLWVHRGGSPLTSRINAAGGCVGTGDDFSQLVLEALWHDLNGQPFVIGNSEHYKRIVQNERCAELAEELWDKVED
jgi:hypothetical protein